MVSRPIHLRNLAVFDSRLDTTTKPSAEIQHQFKAETFDKVALTPRSHVAGFSMDEPGNDDDDEDDDELALAALDSLDAIEVYKTDHRADKTHQAQIPADNWRGLIMLLLIIAPLDSQESLSALAGRIEDSALPGLRRTADSILWAFAPEKNPAISYTMFSTVVGSSLPYLFDGLNPLFEHFLFSKNLDFAKFKSKGLLSGPPSSAYVTLEAPLSPTEPLLPSEGEILNMNTLSQLSFFIKSTDLFRRLRLLYSGNDAGFSINSIQQKVLNWRAPSILLVSGTRLQATANRRAFAETLPASRFPSSSTGNSMEGRVVFGAYLNVPWKQTHREAIGDDRTLLFQLEPVHEVFRASTLNRDYVTFTKSGIGLGVPPPKKAVGGFHSYIVLGAVSLLLDENLEFGVFTHEASGGGAFGTSRTRKGDWQDRFEIESLEVWGCGGDDEAERQRQAWKWEEREAAARRGINLGRDKDADYALLEMAGLVGGHGNSGGSMG